MKLSERIESVYNMGGLKGLYYIGFNYLILKNLPQQVQVLPRSIQIEPTTQCNLRCKMCYINNKNNKNIGFLKIDDFKKIIIENFNYFHILRLWGIGEPLTHPDIFEMIRFEKQRGNKINISTNGILLNPNNIKKILESGLDKINISIDSPIPGEYEYIRRGASFSVLKENLVELKKMREKYKSSIKVSVTTVLMKSNLNKIAEFIPLLKELNINRLALQPLQLDRPGIELGEDESLKNVKKLSKKIIEIKNLFRKTNINISIPEIKTSTIHKNCLWPWLETYINYKGDVTPCCRNIDKTCYICGNIFREKFINIWNNDKYQNFRNMLKNNKLPLLCKDCTML